MDNNESEYTQGTYFALLFNVVGEKEGIIYGTDLESVRAAINDMRETEDLDYIILQVVENPKNRSLH